VTRNKNKLKPPKRGLMETRSKTRLGRAPLPQRVCYMNLEQWIPIKDLRNLVYRNLTEHDRALVKLAHDSRASPMKLYSDRWFQIKCAAEGYLSLLKHLGSAVMFSEDRLANAAAYHGHIHVLEWFKANGGDMSHAVFEAAVRGNLQTVQWFHDNCFEWSYFDCFYVARQGHLNIIQWAVNNKCDIDIESCIRAAKRYPEVVAYLESLRADA
jgi:hypothetical protein